MPSDEKTDQLPKQIPELPRAMFVNIGSMNCETSNCVGIGDGDVFAYSKDSTNLLRHGNTFIRTPAK